ncbi:MAG: hypothetical protein ACRC8Y_08140 [Chroococcales cyanobacterium]
MQRCLIIRKAIAGFGRKGEGWKLIRRVRFTSHHDCERAMASRRQHQAQSDRLEFQVLSYPTAIA